MNIDYSTVTELAGSKASRAQMERVCNRYYFAATFCVDKDVLEVACGAGQGLGYLARQAKRVVGMDIDRGILEIPRTTYHGRRNIEIVLGDAERLAFPDASFDVVILYEALYYIPDAGRFAAEAARVLRPDGVLLICTANKDLPDFNPSPYSHRYYGSSDFRELLEPYGYRVRTLGDAPVGRASLRSRVARTVKAMAVRLHLIPKTMKGKTLLKRLVFGPLVTLPAEIEPALVEYRPPIEIPADRPCSEYAVIHCVAARPSIATY